MNYRWKSVINTYWIILNAYTTNSKTETKIYIRLLSEAQPIILKFCINY